MGCGCMRSGLLPSVCLRHHACKDMAHGGTGLAHCTRQLDPGRRCQLRPAAPRAGLGGSCVHARAPKTLFSLLRLLHRCCERPPYGLMFRLISCCALHRIWGTFP